MKGWRAMRDALSHLLWASYPHRHDHTPTTMPDFDVDEFEQRLVDTERRIQREETRLTVMALEGELPRGHEHDGN